jgi:glycosyltransferase involved in cell wall biosynthesis
MVGISLLTYVPGVFGGSATYSRELLRSLARVGELDYVVFTPTLAPGESEGLPARVVAEYRSSASLRGRLAAMGRATVHPAPIRRHFRGVSVVHYPLTIMVPSAGLPSVATVHDVLHIVHPELFSRPERVYRRLAYRRIAQAERVIVPSEYGRSVLGRGDVIPHGVDHATFFPADVPREPFLLYPADGYPHKNHAVLVQAFRRLDPGMRLVLVGNNLDPAWAGGGVEVRARVGTAELVDLLRRAAALVFPSRHEIFGLPPLEAMACGCPVAAADAAALPEVCGDAAVLFDPLSVDAVEAGLREVLVRGPELSAKGIEHAARFTWDACARAHDAVYRELGG